MAKIPYMIIIGEKEMNENLVSVRRHGQGDLGSMPVEQFVKTVSDAVENEKKF